MSLCEASRKRAEASLRRTKFEVGALAADAYLTLLAAEETVKAAQAAVDRAHSIEEAVGAVVRAELRPGVDLSRSQAESAAAGIQLIQARQAVEIARATLHQFVGLPSMQFNLTTMPAAISPEVTAGAQTHPRALEQAAAVDEVKAREQVLDRSYFPKFNLQGSAYARGSGANVDGTTGGAFSGFGPNIQNWAVGFSIYFPIFDFASIKAKKQIETHNELTESARYSQVLIDLNAQQARAQAALNAARQIAANTPIQLKSARDAETQATARYKAGLSSRSSKSPKRSGY